MVRCLSLFIGLLFFVAATAGAQAADNKSKIRSVPVLLTYSEFKKLSSKQRTRYIGRVKDIFVEYEKMMMKYTPVVENKIRIPIFFETADAGWAGQKCVIGGREGTTAGPGLCSTRTFPCPDEDKVNDGFKCGGIFSNACIPRLPIATISTRCRGESKDTEFEKEVLEAAKKLYNDVCKDEDASKVSCQVLTAKLEKATEKAAAPVTPAPPATPPPATAPPAATPPVETTPEVVDPFPDDPSVRDSEPASETSTRCYEKPSAARCAEGSLTLAQYPHRIENSTGEVETVMLADLASCRRSEDGKPFKYAPKANTLNFLKFLKENKTNRVVIRGLQSFNLSVDHTIRALEGFVSKEGESKDPHFDLNGLPAGASQAAVEEMLVLYNTKNKNNLCEDIVRVRNELAREELVGGARKKLNFDEVKKDADFNVSRKKDFENGCKAGKIPQVKALEIKFSDDSTWNVFPMQIKADGDNKWKFATRDGARVSEGTVIKNQDGSYTYVDDENIEYPVKDFTRIHRSLVNTGDRPPEAKDDPACDSFRPPAAAAAGATTPSTTTK